MKDSEGLLKLEMTGKIRKDRGKDFVKDAPEKRLLERRDAAEGKMSRSP